MAQPSNPPSNIKKMWPIALNILNKLDHINVLNFVIKYKEKNTYHNLHTFTYHILHIHYSSINKVTDDCYKFNLLINIIYKDYYFNYSKFFIDCEKKFWSLQDNII